MSSFLHSRRVESISTAISNTFTKRHGDSSVPFLKGWDIGDNDLLRFSFGLTGVDQKGNFLWVDVFGWMLLFVALSTLGLHIFNMCWRQMRHMSVMGQPQRQAYWKHNRTRWWPWINRYVLAAPLWKKRHNRAFQLSSAIENGTLPGRWHTIILVIYVGLNIAWCCILPYQDEHLSVVAALRGRTGTLAALNLIPTVLFALRNNPLIPLLQVSYDDFNLFHRWAGRITIVEALIHTATWLFNTQKGGGWHQVAAALRDEASYTWGMVGSVSFVFIGIQAWSPIRHAFYETFLNVHRLCVVFALVGLYLHLERHTLPQLPWMWVIFLMWGLEVLMRMVRAGANSINFRQMQASKIRVEAMPGEAVRVTVDLKRPWYPRPGCHVHIYMPAMNPWLPWTSHPFSIAWSPVESPSSKEMENMGLPTVEGQPLPPFSARPSKQISLICRARTGLTRKLYEKAALSPHTMFTTWGAIEGPYGGHHSLDSYGTVLLFAGGVGITHQVMYLKHLVAGFEGGTTAIQRLLLVWTVPESECLEWVRPWMDEVLRMKGRKQVLRVMLFITRPKRQLDSSSSTVKMFPGRPKIASLLAEEMRHRVGAMAVTVCGSGPFADDVRAGVRPFLTEGSVEFIEEAFTY
jgi:predicted ferric reductase